MKKHRVNYLKPMLLINIIIFSTILFLLILYDVKEDNIKQACLSISLISIFMLFRAKHDNRGNNVNNLINTQNMWKKIHVYFFPQEFSDKELEIINNKFQEVFQILKNKKYTAKIGVLFIWIKRDKNKISIKLINQLDYSCDGISEDIIKIYKNIKEFTNSNLDIKGGKDKKIELILEFGRQK
ncbi:hypothetical protein [Clostridium arbusti]|uniref:hypothetical protein n=1 Tax=Clostridium arbusti TaxID=1137848 RepID=UPI0002F29CB9|nr:hypothetical protein [Clostridium arbusti]